MLSGPSVYDPEPRLWHRAQRLLQAPVNPYRRWRRRRDQERSAREEERLLRLAAAENLEHIYDAMWAALPEILEQARMRVREERGAAPWQSTNRTPTRR